MKKLTILPLALFVVLAFHHGYAVIEKGVISLDVEFEEPRITPSAVLPGYDHVEMVGAHSFGIEGVGSPQLPIKGVNILIPFDRKIDRINVGLGERVTVHGRYMVEPGQREYPISQMEIAKITPDGPEYRIYELSTIYPSMIGRLESIQNKMGYSIVVLQLFPVRYVPKMGEISYYRKMTVKIKLTTEIRRRSYGEVQLRGEPEDSAAVYALIDNKEDLVIYKSSSALERRREPLGPINTAEQYDYVIITHPEFKDSFELLKQYRTQKGLPATIVTTDWIYTNYSGVRPDGRIDNQTKIRNFIADAFNIWKTKYVLLGGDGDATNLDKKEFIVDMIKDQLFREKLGLGGLLGGGTGGVLPGLGGGVAVPGIGGVLPGLGGGVPVPGMPDGWDVILPVITGNELIDSLLPLINKAVIYPDEIIDLINDLIDSCQYLMNMEDESEGGIIPARGLKCGDDNNIPADLYYACLDGTFDNNENGIYGEVADAEPGKLDIDLLAEVCVGRAPVDSP